MRACGGNRLGTRVYLSDLRWAGMAGLVAAMLILNGCSSSLYGGWLVRTNSTPLAPGLDPDDLEERPVAVFSALGPPAFRGNEIALTYYLDDVLHKVRPDWKIIPSQETATRINRQGLAAEYSRMRSDYELTSILDRDSLRKIAAAIGARYVFQPRLADFQQMMQDRWIFPAANVRVSQTRSSIMRLSLSMWDTETGELVWASMGEATMEGEAVSQDPVYLEDISRAAWGSILSDFIQRKKGSKYTPLNQFLNNLVRESVPEEDKEDAGKAVRPGPGKVQK
ncbi:MAG: hypothetical protein ABW047_15630 [Nitrospiraceae bacterium]